MKNNNIQKQRKIWFLLLNNFRATILLLALGFILNVAFTTSPNTTQRTRNIGGIEVIEMTVDGAPRLFIRAGGTTEEPLLQEVIEVIEDGELKLFVLDGLIVPDELNLTSPTNVTPVAPPLNTTQRTRNIGGIEVIEMTVDGVPRLFIRAGGTTEEPLFQEVIEFIEDGETKLIALDGLIVLDEFVVATPKQPSDIVGMAIAGSTDHVYVWYNDGTVSSGQSNDLDMHRGLYNYSLPNGKRPSDIVGMAIAGSTDHVYVWYNDGTVSSGRSDDLDVYRGLYNYSLPNGKRPSDIVGMAIAGSTDHVYVWYNDGTVSSGRSDDLDVYRGLYNYSLPNGKRPSDIAGMAIAGSTDHVYVWYNDGTVSSGRSNDLDVYRGLYQYQ